MTIRIRPLAASDLAVADRIFRVAFGTFLGLPDPTAFAGDTDFVRTRFRLAPADAFGAERGGDLVGSVFVTVWGSVGFFGPLSVRPDLWNHGVAQQLLQPVMERFASAGVSLAGLFTFAQSAKHVGLYGKFGFHPRFLTAVMARSVVAPAPAPAWRAFGALSSTERATAEADVRRVGDALHPGLDVTGEMAASAALGLGDTVLTDDGGFALCHVGAGTEAGSGTCYVKMGAVPPGPDADARFGRLLDACDAFATARGATTLVAGVSFARERACAIMRRQGFRTVIQGVAMHRPNVPGYSHPTAFVLDDWR